MSRRGLTIVDVVIALVAIAMLTVFCLAQAVKLDSDEARTQCAANLRQIGQGLMNYSVENRGRFPVVESDIEKPAPACGTPYEDDPDLSAAPNDEARGDEKYRPKPNDVTAAFYLVVSQQGVPSEAMVCPATRQSPWDFGRDFQARDWTNWKGKAGLREHLSYSYQNPYPSKDAVAKRFHFLNMIDKAFVMAADINPGTDALTKVTTRSTPLEMRQANSPNHGRDGQNVLFADGHVDFEQHVFAGIKSDNIYTYGPSGEANPESGGDGIIGPPSDKTDTILLPTAREIGSADADGNLIAPRSPPPGVTQPDKNASGPNAASTNPLGYASGAASSVNVVPLAIGLSLVIGLLVVFLILSTQRRSKKRS